MERTRLCFENIQQVVGSDEFSVILLTDLPRKRALSLICDESMTHQLALRVNDSKLCSNMLPEALVQLLPGDYEIMIYGIHDGQYQVVLQDIEFRNSVRIRISDAILLSLIAKYPIFIEESLMKRQCVPYDENARGVAIPINTMDTKGLNSALQKAIHEENYELASQLRDELKRRKDSKE